MIHSSQETSPGPNGPPFWIPSLPVTIHSRILTPRPEVPAIFSRPFVCDSCRRTYAQGLHGFLTFNSPVVSPFPKGSYRLRTLVLENTPNVPGAPFHYDICRRMVFGTISQMLIPDSDFGFSPTRRPMWLRFEPWRLALSKTPSTTRLKDRYHLFSSTVTFVCSYGFIYERFVFIMIYNLLLFERFRPIGIN